MAGFLSSGKLYFLYREEFSVLCLAMPGVTSLPHPVQLNIKLVNEVRFHL